MRLGTRRSALALAQAEHVAALVRAAGHGDCEIVPIITSGDRGVLAEDKSRWVIELEQALLAGDVDIAVHSAKDLPGELADGLALLGSPARAAPTDVLCGAAELASLPAGARVGTSSLRRMAQLRAAREDLDVVAVRGNVDTRLAKLTSAHGALQAIVLARAGLQRLGREREIGGELDPARFVPAPGQGALAIEGRAGEQAALSAARAITDEDAFTCLLAERALAHELGAGCHTPLGALAQHSGAGGGELRLAAWIGLPDGSAWIADELLGEAGAPEALAAALAQRLLAAGATDMLARAEQMALTGSPAA
jgi:hydroxymethylbilane synthase